MFIFQNCTPPPLIYLDLIPISIPPKYPTSTPFIIVNGCMEFSNSDDFYLVIFFIPLIFYYCPKKEDTWSTVSAYPGIMCPSHDPITVFNLLNSAFQTLVCIGIPCGLVKMQFWFSRSEVGSKVLHFQQALGVQMPLVLDSALRSKALLCWGHMLLSGQIPNTHLPHNSTLCSFLFLELVMFPLTMSKTKDWQHQVWTWTITLLSF